MTPTAPDPTEQGVHTVLSEPASDGQAGYPLILNGDHAEFERDHANTPPKERPDWPLPSFDARDWAEAFCARFPQVDEELMIGWFANALMRGYDEHAARVLSQSPPP